MAPNPHMGKIKIQFWMKMETWPLGVTNQWCVDVFLTTDFSENKNKNKNKP